MPVTRHAARCRPLITPISLDLSNHRPLRVQLGRIAIMRFLFAVLQSRALMVFEETMCAAEMSVAEVAIADYPLGSVRASLKRASLLLGCAAAETEDEM